MSEILARFKSARAVDDLATHARHAQSRDLMLQILADHPEVLDLAPGSPYVDLVRETAIRCGNIGPLDKSIELFRKLAPASGVAGDWFRLSEVLARGDHLEESASALEQAIARDPKRYGTAGNRETLQLARPERARSRVSRYPETKDFCGDLGALIGDHIAANLKGEEKFIQPNATFFTMGSCFARNLARALRKNGFVSHQFDIAEHINTTFANRMFVDYLAGRMIDVRVRERIEELLPQGWSKENMLYLIRHSDVFILTLGVAAAFFDRSNGAFVLPRPSALSARALAERYEFRMTTVKENVDNVQHLIAFVREQAPRIKVVVTVSPVPLMATFNGESAVQADCLSKSTMRLVAHEIVNACGFDNILYWPSFEVFRWGGSQASSFYAADDGAAWHVSEDKVAGTVAAFVKMFEARNAC